MKYNLYAFLICFVFISCKGKENTTSNNPSISKVTDAMEKLPPVSTGWTIAPCKLIDEDYLRKALKIENTAIALIPNVAQNNQGASSCVYRWMKPDFQAIEENNKKLKEAAEKKKTTFSPQATLNVIVISYTGKYADATAAAASLETTAKTSIKAVGDHAIWDASTNQLTIQKGGYVFYVQVMLDPKKNLDVAKQLAIDVCKKI